jgi:hypothetical protein
MSFVQVAQSALSSMLRLVFKQEGTWLTYTRLITTLIIVLTRQETVSLFFQGLIPRQLTNYDIKELSKFIISFLHFPAR